MKKLLLVLTLLIPSVCGCGYDDGERVIHYTDPCTNQPAAGFTTKLQVKGNPLVRGTDRKMVVMMPNQVIPYGWSCGQ
jgi:hypothetical protein